MTETTDHSALIAEGRRVVEAEAEALRALGAAMDNGLGEPFASAVDMILAAKGRVIVSGMGKSGHIARKVAATLASTGTPAHFVHPAEASHGDLGMMATGDVALLLSNSGETTELADMIAYTRRFSINLIGIAGRAGSTLMQRSDVALLLPQVAEAGDSSFVPTTSTTMSLALGDALAMALMQHRRFTPAHFREFHPGGKLGAQLARVSDLMHQGESLPIVPSGTPMSEALLVISQKGFGVVGVTDEAHNLTGVVTDGDLRRHMSGLLDLTVDDVMTQQPSTIAVDALAEEALALMNTRKITCLFVTDGPRPVGILHIHDCLRAGIV
ncbi:KpsF/GutQ family sugar-phosphate isomerase [Alphaproteobacteria bacterium KMM 3653]|uniref:KpsF/GutQ family sugar-phosphate isomerase n=1 Tax=Harenicola maris TaxID=2841044 RepID=A0AAP2G487_9RHOB|nr:KpsF/GutQ family sugar-phosphate isomerase [Harenicola maris]